MLSRRSASTLFLAVGLAVGAAACGDDSSEESSEESSAATTEVAAVNTTDPDTVASTEPAATTEPATTAGPETTAPAADDSDVTDSTDNADSTVVAEATDDTEVTAVADVCEFVGDAAASEATGVTLTGATADGNEIRSVCTYSPLDNDGIGITIGLQSGSRFVEKAATSEEILGPGDDVDDLGDQALSFYDDEDDLGGTLVAVGDLTIDVSIQGLGGDAATREASNALAALVVDGL